MTPPPSHAQARDLLGPAALNLLDPDEQAALDTHVQTCATCAQDLAELTATAGGLALLSPDEADGALLPSAAATAAVTARLVAERSSARRRLQRLQVVCASAAAVAVLVSGAVAAGALRSGSESPAAVPLAVQAAAGLNVEAGYIAHTWGIELRLDGTGFADGATYRVDVRDSNGRMRPAGEFRGTGTRGLRCSFNASVLADDADSFVVQALDGTAVVEGRL